MTYSKKPAHTQKYPNSWFQALLGVESKYVETYLGLGGLSPQRHRAWRVTQARQSKPGVGGLKGP